MALLLVLLTISVAFANGANDVSKGVATLVGAGLASERRAILWGTVWTALGVGAALFVSQGLIAVFSGRGLLAAPPTTLAWPAAIAVAVIGWLVFATRAGLPVSTTHALVGGIVGAGAVAGGLSGINWLKVLNTAGLPLLVSPLISFALVFSVLPVMRQAFRRLGRYCVCVERRELAFAPAVTSAAITLGPELHVIAGEDCPPEVLTRVNALDSMHWLSAGLISFARGLNDAPKILALGLVAGASLGLAQAPLMALVGAAMAMGSYVAGRRVTDTLGTRITPMSGPEALTANTVTSMLVGLASSFGMPVSTTHVATGTVIAVGLHRHAVRRRLVRHMLLAWVVTVPFSAALAAGAYMLLAR